MFIFDRWHRSSAAVSPVKYDRDAKNPAGTLARLKIFLAEELMNAALVAPTPEISTKKRKLYICVCLIIAALDCNPQDG